MKTKKIISWLGAGFLLLFALALLPSLASAALALAGIWLLPLARWQAFQRETLKLSGKGKAVGIAALFLLGIALTPPAQPKPVEVSLKSLAVESAVDTNDFQADTNETVIFRRAQLQVPASWLAAEEENTLYLAPGALSLDAWEESAVTVRPAPLEVPESGLAEPDFQSDLAETFFSEYRGRYVDFAVIQKEFAPAQDGSPERFLCAFEAVRDGVKVSRSAGFFTVGGELYRMEVPCSENDRYNYTGDAYRILCSASAAPESAPEASPEPTPEPTPAPTPESTPEPAPTPASEPTPEPESTSTPEPESSPAPELTPEPASETAPEGVEANYVLNTNTKKFHVPSCSSVKKMKESNKQLYTGTRDDLISQGYSPCGNCNP